MTVKAVSPKNLIKKTHPKNTPLKEDVFYPDTDGKPMAESDFQAEYLMYLVQTLRLYFADNNDVYVSGNLLIYYEEGNPKVCVAPDVFVVFGVANHKRRSYKVWEEGKFPDVVIEITSKTTRTQDEVDKVALYQQLGVKEYFQYDPTGDYLDPILKGRWLDEDGLYQTIIGEKTPKGIRLESRVLGLYLQVDNGELRVYDPTADVFLPTLAEARYQVELERNRAEMERDRAKMERDRAKMERDRADTEAQARQVAEAELKALKAHLKTLGINIET